MGVLAMSSAHPHPNNGVGNHLTIPCESRNNLAMAHQPATDELTDAVIALRDTAPPELHPLLDAIVEDESSLDWAWTGILDGALNEG